MRHRRRGALSVQRARGQLTAITTKGGRTVSRHYHAQGRLLEVQEQAQGQRRLQVRYAYEADSMRPSLVLRPSVVAGKRHRLQIAYNDRAASRYQFASKAGARGFRG